MHDKRECKESKKEAGGNEVGSSIISLNKQINK